MTRPCKPVLRGSHRNYVMKQLQSFIGVMKCCNGTLSTADMIVQMRAPADGHGYGRLLENMIVVRVRLRVVVE